jgi:uncharacterized protein (DUF58 family)
MRIWPPFRREADATPPKPSPSARPGDRIETAFTEETLVRLRRITLSARRSLADGLAGEHHSRRRGASPEFADFKSYTQGDDFRQIDWNIYARLNELFIRLSEVTTEFDLHLLLDASASMNWSGLPTLPTKFTYAKRVVGALGYIALWHFDRLTVSPFGTVVEQSYGPVQGRSHVIPLLRFLERVQAEGRTDIAQVLTSFGRGRRRPGIMIVASDLLSGEPSEIGTALRNLRSRGWRVTVLHIVDPAERDPAFALDSSTPLTEELLDLEDASRMTLTPTSEVIDRYREAYQRWLTEIERVVSEEALTYVRLETDWEFDETVLRFLHDQEVVA